MIIIITSNSVIKNGNFDKVYHEIHEINNLNNANHIIATINSIIANNILYKNDNTKLTDVFISCSNEEFQKEVMNYYKSNNINDIKIEDI